MLRQQVEQLQALAVGQQATGAPERRLKRRLADLRRTLQSAPKVGPAAQPLSRVRIRAGFPFSKRVSE